MGGDQRRMDSGQLAEPEHRLASCFCHLEGMCCDWQQSWLLTLAGWMPHAGRQLPRRQLLSRSTFSDILRWARRRGIFPLNMNALTLVGDTKDCFSEQPRKSGHLPTVNGAQTLKSSRLLQRLSPWCLHWVSCTLKAFPALEEMARNQYGVQSAF